MLRKILEFCASITNVLDLPPKLLDQTRFTTLKTHRNLRLSYARHSINRLGACVAKIKDNKKSLEQMSKRCQKKKLERNTLTSANSFRFSESSWHRREPRQIPYICLMGVSCLVYFCFILFFDFFRYVLLFIFARKRKREIRNNFVVLHDNCGCN